MLDTAPWQGFLRNIQVDLRRLTEGDAKAALTQAVISERDRVLRGTPRPSGYRQIVDRVEAPLSAITAASTIILAWQYLDAAVRRIYGLMLTGAPKITGDYARSITIFADGADVTDRFLSGGMELPATATIAIAATVPYSRRLEVGRDRSGGAFAVQVPMHNVEQIAAVARRLVGDIAAVKFTFVDLGAGYRIGGSRSKRTIGAGVHRRVADRIRYPAIIITARTA